MSDFSQLSQTLGTNERTLRRAANLGLLRSARVSERRAQLPAAERLYFERHWPVIAALRRALRTEPNVAMAVLFGSVARGDDDTASDIDVLVDLRDADWSRMLDLQQRLTTAAGGDVHLVRLSDAERDPTFLAAILEDGRVLCDRGGRWLLRRGELARTRQRGERDFADRARAALAAAHAAAGA